MTDCQTVMRHVTNPQRDRARMNTYNLLTSLISDIRPANIRPNVLENPIDEISQADMELSTPVKVVVVIKVVVVMVVLWWW